MPASVAHSLRTETGSISLGLLIRHAVAPLSCFVVVRPRTAHPESGDDRIIKHGSRLEVSGTAQVFLDHCVIEFESEAGLVGNAYVAFTDDWLGNTGNQVLPPWHIERMVLHGEEIVAECGGTMISRETADRRSGMVHGHLNSCHFGVVGNAFGFEEAA